LGAADTLQAAGYTEAADILVEHTSAAVVEDSPVEEDSPVDTVAAADTGAAVEGDNRPVEADPDMEEGPG